MINEEKAVLWRSRLDSFEQSGMSIKEFCRQNSLEPRSYRYWRSRLGEVKLPFVSRDVSGSVVSSKSPSWLCIDTASESTPCSPEPNPFLTVRISGAEIDVHSGFNEALLRSIVQALGGGECWR